MMTPAGKKKALRAWGLKFAGLSYQQIALRLGVSAPRVPQLLFKAYRELLRHRVRAFQPFDTFEIPAGHETLRVDCCRAAVRRQRNG